MAQEHSTTLSVPANPEHTNILASPYFHSGAGIAASVLLFWLGYRKTVGARKERARAADLELEQVLLRRVVQDSYRPRLHEIERLISAKARSYQCNVSELASAEDLLNALFAQIVGNDFLPTETRHSLLKSLEQSLTTPPASTQARLKTELLQANTAFHYTSAPHPPHKRDYRTTVRLLALLSSALGAGLSALLALSRDMSHATAFPITLVFAMSLAMIAGMYVIHRTRSEGEEIESQPNIDTGTRLEQEVLRLLRQHNINHWATTETAGADLFAVIHGETTAIETKPWKRAPKLSHVTATLRSLTRAARWNAARAILITPVPIDSLLSAIQGCDVQAMSIAEFEDFLVTPTTKSNTTIQAVPAT